VFDEEVPEESHLLRHSVGGHVKEDICCLTVSTDLSLIATGSCSGIIAVWDFESNKVDSICMEHNK
jgi:WD40 repeat protein